MNPLATAATSLARSGIPTDVLELLTSGDPARGIPPGALYAALVRVRVEDGESLERENSFLRVKYQQAGGCPYGHHTANGGCDLGYPGCACMDDLLALQAWHPDDEERAVVRLGRLLYATQGQLQRVREALQDAARELTEAGRQDAGQSFAVVAAERVTMALAVTAPTEAPADDPAEPWIVPA